MTFKHLLFLSVLLCACSAYGQEFNEHFIDKTLRIDYMLTGSAEEQEISIDGMSQLPRWYGKRENLQHVAAEGNGQVLVYDHKTQQLLFKNSFSTLFQEWQSYPEASSIRRSFEHVILLPYPIDTIDVCLQLFNNRRQVVAQLQHSVSPTDILIQPKGYDTTTPFKVIFTPSDTLHAINIAFLAEGYTEKEMDVYLHDVATAVDALFEHEPFKQNKDKFRVVAVMSPSADSGVSLPRESQWRQTAVGSHFDTFHMDRYLTTLHLKQVHDLLAGIPYEHIIILANTSTYGGGGVFNFFNLTATHHRYYKEVVVHEFGHSFAGLADEYAYESEPLSIYDFHTEPWEPNITTLVDFSQKWKDMSEAKLYEGAGYALKGIYRPFPDCRMRTNQFPDFCPVCQQAIQRTINNYFP